MAAYKLRPQQMPVLMPPPPPIMPSPAPRQPPTIPPRPQPPPVIPIMPSPAPPKTQIPILQPAPPKAKVVSHVISGQNPFRQEQSPYVPTQQIIHSPPAKSSSYVLSGADPTSYFHTPPKPQMSLFKPADTYIPAEQPSVGSLVKYGAPIAALAGLAYATGRYLDSRVQATNIVTNAATGPTESEYENWKAGKIARLQYLSDIVNRGVVDKKYRDIQGELSKMDIATPDFLNGRSIIDIDKNIQRKMDIHNLMANRAQSIAQMKAEMKGKGIRRIRRRRLIVNKSRPRQAFLKL